MVVLPRGRRNGDLYECVTVWSRRVALLKQYGIRGIAQWQVCKMTDKG